MASLENYPCALVMNVYFQTLDVLKMSGKHNCFLLSMWRMFISWRLWHIKKKQLENRGYDCKKKFPLNEKAYWYIVWIKTFSLCNKIRTFPLIIDGSEKNGLGFKRIWDARFSRVQWLAVCSFNNTFKTVQQNMIKFKTF